MSQLTLTIVQWSPLWEDKKSNLDYLNTTFRQLPETDLILLPEMFATGFTMNVQEMGEPMDGPVVSWIKSQAETRNAVVAGSCIIAAEGGYYNRLICAFPDGAVQHYDKKHLFSMGEEHLHYTPGRERVTILWKGWRIRPLICYDLRFPVWSRNHDDYDLLIYLANWPSPRHQVWKTLLVARALENQCWCAGVNRTGTDGMNLDYSGDSGLVDPRGNAVWLGDAPSIYTAALIKDDLTSFRKKFPVLNDRDPFELTD